MFDFFSEQKTLYHQKIVALLHGIKAFFVSFWMRIIAFLHAVKRFFWRLLRWILKIIFYVFAGIGVLVSLIVLVGLGLGLKFYEKNFTQDDPLPNQILLVAEMDKISTEKNLSCQFFQHACPLTITRFIEGLERAAKDDSVKGLLVLADKVQFPSSLGAADMQAFRKAVQNFKKSGKKSWVYHHDLGGFGHGTMDYYFASAFDQIILAPSGAVGLSGLKLEFPFIADALDRLKIRTNFETRHEYKSAVSTLLHEQIPEPQRENMEDFLNSLFGFLYQEIAKGRNITSKELDLVFERFAIPADEALDLKLVDAVQYRDDLSEWLDQQFDIKMPEKVTFTRYFYHRDNDIAKDDEALHVALLEARGTIIDGGSNQDFPLSNPANITPERFNTQLSAVVENEDIDAIIIMISSPGGSYTASDRIWNAINKARKEKPVIAMMGDIAASGGYFIAMAADEIIAQPTSLTGSIGVVAGGVAMRDFFAQWGVYFDSVSSQTPGGASGLNGLDVLEGVEKIEFSESIDRIYRDFTTKLAQSRNLSNAEIDRVARGRIWTGKQAFENRLIDRLGGIDSAKDAVRDALGKDKETPVALIDFSQVFDNPLDKIKFFLENTNISHLAFLIFPAQSRIIPNIFFRDRSQEVLHLPFFTLTD